MGNQPGPATGSQPAPLLTVTGLGKSYRRRPVLRDVGLQAHPGQIVAVTGENGSGKTTLLRICAGLETADTGTVHLRAGAGYCPQEPALAAAAAVGILGSANPSTRRRRSSR